MPSRDERLSTVSEELRDRLRERLPAEQQHLAETLSREVVESLSRNSAEAREVAGSGGPPPEWRDALFDAVYDALLVVDPDCGTILDANATACDLLGYTREELRRLEVADIHPYEMAEIAAFAERVRAFGRWQTDELTCRHRCGQFIPAELSATPVRYGGRDALLVAARDIRQQKLAALGMTVSQVAHDLRNMLGSMQLLSDCLKRVDEPVVQGVLPRLQRSLERANRLCSATLAEGRVREPEPERRRFALAGLVHDVADALGLGHQEEPVWRMEVPGDLAVDADPDQLYRVLLNLLRNALQALQSQGSGAGMIRLTATQGDDGTEICISDTGPGLPEPLRQQGLDTAARGPWTTGSGLGLAICRDLMSAHGGRVEIVSSGPEGTTFRLWLPHHAAAAGAEPAADSTHN